MEGMHLWVVPMTPHDIERLIRRIRESMDASHRLHQELLTALEQLLREQQPPSEPTPPKKPAGPDKWAGHLYLDTRGAAEYVGLSPRTLEQWRVKGGGRRSSRWGAASATRLLIWRSGWRPDAGFPPLTRGRAARRGNQRQGRCKARMSAPPHAVFPGSPSLVPFAEE
jgi:hypothetical protein